MALKRTSGFAFPTQSLSTIMDDLFTTVEAIYRPTTSTGDAARYVTDRWSPWEYQSGRLGRLSTIDELIRDIREEGLETDVFERAKSAYSNLPSFPACDIAVDKENGHLYFDIALPGYREEDIDVTFENDVMEVQVAKDNKLSESRQDSDKLYLRNGLKSSSVQFRTPVPFSRFSVKEAQARYENGMLHIVVPRKEDHQPHRIAIGNSNTKSIEE